MRTRRCFVVSAAVAALCFVSSTLGQTVSVNDLARHVERSVGDKASTGGGPVAAAVGESQLSCLLNPESGDFADPYFPDSNAIISDLTGVGFGQNGGDPLPVRCADNFFFLSNGEIIGVTWWGIMADNSALPGGSTADCAIADAPAAEDRWTIRIWAGKQVELLSGFVTNLPDPDGLLAEFENVFGNRVQSGPTYLGFTHYEMQFTFPVPLEVDALATHHLEIFNNYTFNDCFFAWATAPAGDEIAHIVFHDVDDPKNWDPANEDLVDPPAALDFNYCIDFFSFGPLPNAPSIELEVAGLADTPSGCCTFKYTVRNLNSPGAGAVTKFWMALHKGDGDDRCGEDLTEISPPPGYSVTFCEMYSSGFAIYEFEGGSIGEAQSTFGHITLQVNDFTEDDLLEDGTEVVPAFGIRAWGSQDALIENDVLCGTGQFTPLIDSPFAGKWSSGADGVCTLRPIPAMSMPAKAILAMLLVGGGVMLVLRSRKVIVA